VAEERNPFLTVAETARLLQRSTEQVRRYLREGVIPGRRIGGQWFIDRADAESFLQKRREGSHFATSLAASDPDPLGMVIAIGGSGGGDVASGMAGYLRSTAGVRQT
jgi:excisionase family DNA binding protein